MTCAQTKEHIIGKVLSLCAVMNTNPFQEIYIYAATLRLGSSRARRLRPSLGGVAGHKAIR